MTGSIVRRHLLDLISIQITDMSIEKDLIINSEDPHSTLSIKVCVDLFMNLGGTHQQCLKLGEMFNGTPELAGWRNCKCS